mmetsp:Transcript_28695/g.54208  ORF Transcript_28695/g.54208 Transcript_28695/m.54208 type:complete len:278 (+) Transcript_28695:119-952(+)
MRITREHVFVQPNPVENFHRAINPVTGRPNTVNFKRLTQRVFHPHPRIKRAVGILKHHLRLALELQPGSTVQILKIHRLRPGGLPKQDRSSRIRPFSAQRHTGTGGFAGAGLADHSKRFAALDAKIHTAYRVDHRLGFPRRAAFQDVGLVDVAHFQNVIAICLVRPICGCGRNLWRRRHQIFGVGVLRVAKDQLGGATFHHPTPVHHNHVIGHIGDHAKVMRDQNHRHAVFGLQVFDQAQHLRLRGHVQRRCRLIRDQNIRTPDHRHSYHRPLPHPA